MIDLTKNVRSNLLTNQKLASVATFFKHGSKLGFSHHVSVSLWPGLHLDSLQEPT